MTDALTTLRLFLALAVGVIVALAPSVAQARTAHLTHSSVGEPASGSCIIQTLPPSFVDQGEFGTSSSVADVVRVSCEPVLAGQSVKLSSQQLFNRCKGGLSWSAPFPYAPVPGPSFSVKLDGDGNATAVLWGGPSCAPGESLVSAHLEAPPYTTFTTDFMILPPAPSMPGVTAMPSSEVEDSVFSSVATIVEVEFPPVYAERRVNISAEQLFARCMIPPSLVWVGADDEVLASGTEDVETTLDNDGNAFVVVLGGGSCASGDSLIEASLTEAPFTTYTTEFPIEPPGTSKHPEYAIEKLQEIPGSGAGFTKSPLTGSIGQTVDYEIVVTNTGETPLKFSNLTDAKCDPGTIAGGPGAAEVAPGESTIYTCDHMLTSVGKYVNEATVTGTPPGETPKTKTSNPVEVEVPTSPVPTEFTIEKLQEIMGSGFTKAKLTGQLGETVTYEIVVTNTGKAPLTLSKFIDSNCDPGTIAGGPGSTPVAPNESTTYTCDHVLTSIGTYINEATVTGDSEAEPPLTKTSNPVEVVVPLPLTEPPEFTIEKLQELQGTVGSGGTFTKQPVTGTAGETVDYEILVTNIGNVPLTLSNFIDPNCDSATISGGPGVKALAPKEMTIYTCSHVLSSSGPNPYINEATVTGTTEGELPLTKISNPVEAKLPGEPKPANKEEHPGQQGVEAFKSPIVVPAGTTTAKCAQSAALSGAAGPKRKTFTVQTSARGIKLITFYLDGHKLKTLKQSQAKHGKFTLKIDPLKLSLGAHKLVAKTVMSDPACTSPAHSSVFVRPVSQRTKPKFTG
ncbi:MAG TPA: hypothetical protein VN892_13595 [Solirubrobacteraceae bacterium]|nr:hypothetical protein [Solirubrobacteraceae bacterium]